MSEEIVIKSDIGGTVWKISAVQGQIVAQEETLLVVECMKLEVPVIAPTDGVVLEILVAEGQTVEEDQPIIRLTALKHA